MRVKNVLALRALSDGVMLLAVLLSIVSTLLLSQSSTSTPGSDKAVVLPNNPCDKMVKSYRPSFFSSQWKINCTPKISGKDLNISGEVFGVTYLNDARNIRVSRETPQYLLQHVITHEWVHAYMYDHRRQLSVEWREWLHLLRERGHQMEGVQDVEYVNDPDEILADNAASCYLGEKYNVTGVESFSCETVWGLFPELKPGGLVQL